MTASASRPPNFTFSVFTCPTASLNLLSDAGESTPARQPYLFHPTADLPFRLYLSDSASMDLPSDAGESTPARQPYLFNLLRNEAHPSDTAISKPVGRRQEPPRQQPHLFLLDEAYPSDTAISKPVGRQREPTGQSNLSFPFCGRQKPTQPRCWLTEAFRPLNSTLLSKPVHSVSQDIPTDAGESTPGQTTFSFQIYARRC